MMRWLLLSFILTLTGCKSTKEMAMNGSDLEALPSSLPAYSYPSFKRDMPVKYEIAKTINAKYGVGPRLRFDTFLDNIAEEYFPCWDSGTKALVDPKVPVCLPEKWRDQGGLCSCSIGPDGLESDCICKYPETRSAEKDAIRYIIEASREVSELAARNGYSFTIEPLELYMVYLGEAAYIPLAYNQFTNIDGYTTLGVDNLSESMTDPLRKKYEPWVTPAFKQWLHTEARVSQCTNELAQTCFTPSNFDIKNSVYALATEYAYFKSVADKRLFAAKGVHIERLPTRGQLFWTYLHFNAGEGIPIKFNVNRYDERQNREDNYGKNFMSAVFNAAVRTSTFAYWTELCKRNLGIAPQLCPLSENQ